MSYPLSSLSSSSLSWLSKLVSLSLYLHSFKKTCKLQFEPCRYTLPIFKTPVALHDPIPSSLTSELLRINLVRISPSQVISFAFNQKSHKGFPINFSPKSSSIVSQITAYWCIQASSSLRLKLIFHGELSLYRETPEEKQSLGVLIWRGTITPGSVSYPMMNLVSHLLFTATPSLTRIFSKSTFFRDSVDTVELFAWNWNLTKLVHLYCTFLSPNRRRFWTKLLLTFGISERPRGKFSCARAHAMISPSRRYNFSRFWNRWFFRDFFKFWNRWFFRDFFKFWNRRFFRDFEIDDFFEILKSTIFSRFWNRRFFRVTLYLIQYSSGPEKNIQNVCHLYRVTMRNPIIMVPK